MIIPKGEGYLMIQLFDGIQYTLIQARVILDMKKKLILQKDLNGAIKRNCLQ